MSHEENSGHNYIKADKALVPRGERSRGYPTPFQPAPGGPYSDIPLGLEPEKRIGLRDYWQMIRARSRLALISCILVFLGGALYTLSTPRVYKSEAVLQVVEAFQQAGFALGPKKYAHPSAFVDGEVMLLSSDSMFEDFADWPGGWKWPAEHLTAGNRLETLKTNLLELTGEDVEKRSDRSDPTSERFAGPDMVFGHLAEHLSVAKIPGAGREGSNMIDLKLEAYDPQTAKSLLDSFIDFYLQRNLALIRAEIEEARTGLRTQLTKSENRLMEAEAELIRFANKHGIMSKTEAGIDRLLSTLNKSLDKLKKAQEDKKRIGASESLPLGREGTIAQGGRQDPLVAKLKEDIAGLELEYAKMISLYSPRYPPAVQIQKRLEILKEKLRESQKQATDRALAALKRDEAVIRDTIDQTKKEMEQANVLETRHALLKKRVDTARKSYEEVLTALNEADVKWGAAVNNVSVLRKPRINPAPVRPNISQNLVFSILFALVAAVAVPVVVAHVRSDSVEGPREVTDELGVTTLGIVPEFCQLDGKFRRALHEAPYEFLAHEAPNSPMADSINCILTSIGLTHPASTLKHIAVSSSLPGEGKTLISVSLASKMHAGGDKRTLLIDADMRRPRIHKVFGQGDADMGLSSILGGEDVRLEDAVRPYGIKGLYYLTAGPLVADPVALLRSDRMADLMDEVKARFDYVVFDCPPMLGLPDVPIVCNYAAGIILVARQGHLKKDDLRLAITAASSMAATEFLGVVLNRVGKQGKGYGYGGYGGYGYGSYGGYGYVSSRVSRGQA